ncbi:hypothetical protein ACQPX6_29365 [Actinomycetospora sp. CA-101289]|uniref:hypothetical protein n=1 Tax=Actinomycetospora sp. CA-101289 TaxID=3239893 RepID=UPI003D99A283
MGDQIYLDAPFTHFRGHSISTSSLERWVASVYQRGWDTLGYFMTHGASMNVTEDHEYWNNFPHVPSRAWRALRDEATREVMLELAVAHAELMQLAEPVRAFVIGPSEEPDISFFVTDTRVNRTFEEREDARFMDATDFDRLLDWVGNLPCPGVLVLGQPLLTAPGGGNDWNLPAYEQQYLELCSALLHSPRDVIILCGDVHFGRIARIEGPGRDDRGVSITEVISSPLAVLDPAGAYFDIDNPADDLTTLPVGHVGDTDTHRGRVTYLDCMPIDKRDEICEDHFVTVNFSRTSPSEIDVEICGWRIRAVDENSVPLRAMENHLTLR